MRITYFLRLLAIRGTALDAWPIDERAAAKQVLAASPEARKQYRSLRQLEDALREARLPESNADFIPRILAAAKNTPQNTEAPETNGNANACLALRFLTFGGCTRIAASLLLLGFMGGYLTGGSTESALSPWQILMTHEWSWI